MSDSQSIELKLLDPPLPEAVNWSPDAPGWFLLGGLVLLCILFYLFGRYKNWRRNRYRTRALRRLANIQRQFTQDRNRQVLVHQLAELLKQTVSVAHPGVNSDSLSGEAWLVFLNGLITECEISHELIEWPLWPDAQLREVTPTQIDAQIEQIHYWIEHHRASI